MRGWVLSRYIRGQPLSRLSRPRLFSSTSLLNTPHTEHVEVPCASSGDVIVRYVCHLILILSHSKEEIKQKLTRSHSLHDIAKHPVTTPLIINLPACPVQDVNDVDSYLPRFLHRYPCATIHYRWPNARRLVDPTFSPPPPPSPPPGPDADADESSRPRPLRWPTPVHDALAGYDHLLREFAPPLTPAPAASDDWYDSRYQTQTQPQQQQATRDVYVVGSHLGAGLAASLALTESHTGEPMAVRGLLALNGVYNWTTFLPDHPVQCSRAALAPEYDALGRGDDLRALEDEDEADLGVVTNILGKLYARPGDVFDPFASPALFFHSPGLMVPPDFGERWRAEYLIDTPSSESDDDKKTNSDADLDSDSDSDSSSEEGVATLRRGFFVFPPLDSKLKIPNTLLLHSTPPPLPALPRIAPNEPGRLPVLHRRLRKAENSFGSQAAYLAGLMRRSVKSFELNIEGRWEDEADDCEDVAFRRVKTEDVGRVHCRDGRGFGEQGEEVARQWLEKHLG